MKELEQRLEHETRAHLGEMENFKSKLIIERHQREKEHNDHGVMIRWDIPTLHLHAMYTLHYYT